MVRLALCPRHSETDTRKTAQDGMILASTGSISPGSPPPPHLLLKQHIRRGGVASHEPLSSTSATCDAKNGEWEDGLETLLKLVSS